MFERLTERAQRRAEARARERAAELAERMRSELPRGIRAQATGDGVEIEGRAVRRRFALEPGLRWLTGRLR